MNEKITSCIECVDVNKILKKNDSIDKFGNI